MQYLPSADLVVVMREGAIAEIGTYPELSARGVDFSTVVKKVEEDMTGTVVLTPIKDAVPSTDPPSGDDISNLQTQSPSESKKKDTYIAPDHAIKVSAVADIGSEEDATLPLIKGVSMSNMTQGRSTERIGGMSESDRISLLRTLTLKERDGKVTKVRGTRLCSGVYGWGGAVQSIYEFGTT